MKNYPDVELVEICDIYQPKTITSKEITLNGLYPVFGANGQIGFYDKFNHEESEVLITCRGATTGTVNFSKPKSWITGNSMVIKPISNRICKPFLFYFLKYNNLSKLVSGSAQPQITRSVLVSFKIPIVPLSEQQRIVSILEEIDNLRQKQRKAIELTKQTTPTLFYEMFGDLESNEKGFDRIKVQNVTTINPKNQANFKDSDEITFVPMSAINAENASIHAPEVKLIAKTRRKGFSYFEEGDILFAKITPCMQNKKSAIAKRLINGIGYGSTEFHVLRPSSSILGEYLLQILRLPKFIEIAKKHFTGTAGQQRVSKDFIANFIIPLPPIELQKRFTVKAKESLSLLEHQEQSLQKLDTLFESTLNQFFST